MKKASIIITILLGLTFSSFAQEGGMFGYGETRNVGLGGSRGSNESLVEMPSGHGLTDDASAPLGSGVLMLIGFGAAYALKKKKEEK